MIIPVEGHPYITGFVVNAGSDDRGSALYGAAVGVGFEVQLTGALREEYMRRAAKLRPDDIAGRNALKAEFRARQTALGKAITREILKQREAAGRVSGTSNASRTSASVNNAGSMMKYGGRVLMVVGLAGEVYTIVTTPEEERATEAARAGGRVARGLADAAAGAELDSPGEPYGVAGGAIVGGVVGSIVGEAAVDAILQGGGGGAPLTMIMEPGGVIVIGS